MELGGHYLDKLLSSAKATLNIVSEIFLALDEAFREFANFGPCSSLLGIASPGIILNLDAP